MTNREASTVFVHWMTVWSFRVRYHDYVNRRSFACRASGSDVSIRDSAPGIDLHLGEGLPVERSHDRDQTVQKAFSLRPNNAG